MAKKFTVKVLEGRMCIFCVKWSVYRLADGRVKCKSCRRLYSIKRLKRDIDILYHLYLEVSANKAAAELDLSYNTVHDRYMFFREKSVEYLDSNFRKLSGNWRLMKAISVV